MTALAFFIAGAALLALGVFVWYIRDHLPALGAALLTRPGLAAGALLLSLGAGAVFSVMLASIIAYLQSEKRSDDLAYLAFGLLAVLALTMWSLHRLLGSKLAIDLELWKLRAKFAQGDEPTPVTVVNPPSDPVPVESAKGA
jgi:hypothetical protein